MDPHSHRVTSAQVENKWGMSGSETKQKKFRRGRIKEAYTVE